MKALRKLYHKIFKRYNVLETKCVTYSDGDRMIRENDGKPESEQWVLSDLEDNNMAIGMVFLCRKVRITG